MKELFIGLVVGAIAAWGWYHTGGKINITETRTITNEVEFVITVTQTIEQVAYITKTNDVWKTNIVEKLTQVTPSQVAVPANVQKIEQPIQVVKPAERPVAPVVKQSTGLKGGRAAGGVNVPGSPYGKIKTGAKRNLDGSIK